MARGGDWVEFELEDSISTGRIAEVYDDDEKVRIESEQGEHIELEFDEFDYLEFWPGQWVETLVEDKAKLGMIQTVDIHEDTVTIRTVEGDELRGIYSKSRRPSVASRDQGRCPRV